MLFFADNTVLVNFAHIGRVDLLELMANGGAHWTRTVAQECAASAVVPGLTALTGVPAFFAEPESPQGAEWVDLQSIRDRLSRPGDSPKAHLGEAETLAIMARRFQDFLFVTDDTGAKLEAGRVGIKTTDTGQLIIAGVRTGLVSTPDGWAYFQHLRVAGRHPGSAPANESEFLARVAPLGRATDD